MEALHRVAEAERERLLRIRGLYRAGLYWKGLFLNEFLGASINASARGRCQECGEFRNLYLFSHSGLSKRLCKACMEGFLRSHYKKQ